MPNINVDSNTLFAVDETEMELAVKAVYVDGGRVVGVQTVDNRVLRSGFSIYTGRDFLKLEGVSTLIYEGSVVRLSKFDDSPWTVRKGWYAVNGNPEIWGWYLESIPVGTIRSLQLRDLATIEVICNYRPGVTRDNLPFDIYVNSEPTTRIGNSFYVTVPLYQVDLVLTDQSNYTYDDILGRLTARATGWLVIDGIEVVVGQRILVASQYSNTEPEDMPNNGIYIATDIGTNSTYAVLTREPHFVIDDSNSGASILVKHGTYANTRWNLVTPAPIIPEVTELEFAIEQHGNT